MSQPSRTVEIDTALYPLAALNRTLEAYAGHCEADVMNEPTRRSLRIRPTTGAPPSTIDEFLSYLLGASLEIHLHHNQEGA
jgi:hypothetical protein